MEDKLKHLRKSMTGTVMKDVVVQDNFKQNILQKTQYRHNKNPLLSFTFLQRKFNLGLSIAVCSALFIGMVIYASNEMGLLLSADQAKLTNGGGNKNIDTPNNNSVENNGENSNVNNEIVISKSEQAMIEEFYKDNGWSKLTSQYNQSFNEGELNGEKGQEYMKVLETASNHLKNSGHNDVNDFEIKYITEKNNNWILIFKSGIAVGVDGNKNEVIKTWIVD